MKIALCQINPVMGDICGNLRRAVDTLESVGATADMVVFPEMFLQGYPPRDLLDHSWFLEQSQQALDHICSRTKQYPETAVIIGTVFPNRNTNAGKGLYNAAACMVNGEIVLVQPKTLLPNYDVFDETRYFDSGETTGLFSFKGKQIGVSICEDAWNDSQMWDTVRYHIDPVHKLARMGADILINISSSPFHSGKELLRYQLMQKHASRNALPFVFVNQVGGNDELVFDGNSLVFDSSGTLRYHGAAFTEEVRVFDISTTPEALEQPRFDTVESVYHALVLGVRDYVKKCGFCRAFIALSGGIDSAVTAALAVAALGAENVTGITLPSRYSSGGSVDDSHKLAQQLGIVCKEIAIEPVFAALLDAVSDDFAGTEPGTAEENLQAPIRGTIMMAYSNKFGALLLSTGNKSEMAVGYCTLYGDMNGGLSVISDIKKTRVYELARYINSRKAVIPHNTIEKPPSAELRPDQKDQDSLPPYDILDAVLTGLIEEDKSREQLLNEGFDSELIDWVVKAVRINEYKRRQAAPGIKVTPKAFGVGRRFPIAAHYDFSQTCNLEN